MYKKNPMRTPCWKMIRNVLLLNIIKTCRFHRACWHTALTWPLLISRLSLGLSHPLSPHEVGRRGWGSLFPSCFRSVRQIEDSTPNTDEPIVVRPKKYVIYLKSMTVFYTTVNLILVCSKIKKIINKYYQLIKIKLRQYSRNWWTYYSLTISSIYVVL